MSTAPAPTLPRRRARLGKRFVLGGLAALALLLVVGYFVVGSVIATRLMTPRRLPVDRTPAELGLRYEALTIPSFDETSIAAWYLPLEGSERAILMVHGVNSNRTVEMEGHFMELARDLHQAGFSVLMMDMRAHGESGGSQFSLGDRERWDVSAAVGWLAAQGVEQIGVLGVSMGGASSAEASVVDDRIDALVIDSVYPDLSTLLAREFPKRSGLPPFFLPGALLAARVTMGADLNGVHPAAHTGPDPTPLLVIYGTADDLIPASEFNHFQEANPDATTWIVPGARHAGSYLADREGYLDRVLPFFDEHLR